MRPDGSVWLRSPRFGSDTCWGLLVLGVAPLTPRLSPFSSDRNIPTRALKPDPKTPIPYRMSLSLKVASEYPQVSMPGALAAWGAPRGAAEMLGTEPTKMPNSIAVTARNVIGRRLARVIIASPLATQPSGHGCATAIQEPTERATRPGACVHKYGVRR